MAQALDGSDPPLTEPRLVPCLFATGAAVETAFGVARMVFWVHTPELGGETEERRIIARIAVPIEAARQLTDDLRAAASILTQ